MEGRHRASDANIYVFEWGRHRANSSVVHRPEVCLPASGHRLRLLGEWSPEGASIHAPYSVYQIGPDEAPGYVFYSVAERRSGELLPGAVAGRWGRIRAAWAGRRILSRQAIEIFVRGADLESAKGYIATRDGRLFNLIPLFFSGSRSFLFEVCSLSPAEFLGLARAAGRSPVPVAAVARWHRGA